GAAGRLAGSSRGRVDAAQPGGGRRDGRLPPAGAGRSDPGGRGARAVGRRRRGDRRMKVEIWSDVVCPWCYIGKRRFESALAGFEHRDDVEVVWRSFELDPSAPARRSGDSAQRLADKYGMSREQAVASQDRLTEMAAGEGLAFHFENAQSGNTFDAHRLLHLASERGLQDEVKERLFRAYFSEGE